MSSNYKMKETLLDVLHQTLSPDKFSRETSEQKIKSLEAIDGILILPTLVECTKL